MSCKELVEVPVGEVSMSWCSYPYPELQMNQVHPKMYTGTDAAKLVLLNGDSHGLRGRFLCIVEHVLLINKTLLQPFPIRSKST